MHYTTNGQPTIYDFDLAKRKSLITRIREEIVPRIPKDSWKEVDRTLPLRHSTSMEAIVAEGLHHCTGERNRTDAVYVLECLQTHGSVYRREEFADALSGKWENRAKDGDRLIYVGVTVNALRRLNQHLNRPDPNSGSGGAFFTTVFPPIRILDISWYRSYERAATAEKKIANELRKRFSDDCIYQM
jgi:predicted GIY-YIG superfamily endonuclease